MNPNLAPLCASFGAGHPPARHGRGLWPALAMVLVLCLQGCSTVPENAARAPAAANPPAVAASQARNARDYRRDAAQHLYSRYAVQIYKGRLPPMLYAVGVLHVDIGRQGQVLALHLVLLAFCKHHHPCQFRMLAQCPQHQLFRFLVPMNLV